jgi:flagellin-like protein
MKFVKGVSPVIATIILVLIAVVAGVLLWLWTSGFTSALPAQQQALYERIKIEGVLVTKDGGTSITAYVRNIGNVNVSISTVYILKPDGTIIEIPETITVKDLKDNEIQSVSPGNVAVVTVSVTTNKYSPGYAYTIKVVTANGAEAAYTFVWPA